MLIYHKMLYLNGIYVLDIPNSLPYMSMKKLKFKIRTEERKKKSLTATLWQNPKFLCHILFPHYDYLTILTFCLDV